MITKTNFTIILCFYTLSLLQSQKISWPAGYNQRVNENINQSFWIDINGDIISTNIADSPIISFESTVASLIDSSSGKLLFYSNGCKILNSVGEIMKNGDQVNSGDLHNEVCDHYGYLLDHSMAVINYPGKPGIFILLHMRGLDRHEPYYTITDLMYSVIDMNGDDKKGEVIAKDVEIQHGDLIPFAYTRHANGRDWWLILAERISNKYFSYLIEPSGIRLANVQPIGKTISNDECSAGQRILFSPDGIQIARYSRCGVQIINFDRCDGVFYSEKYIPYVFENLPGGDIAFSENGLYLFVSNWEQIIRISIKDIGVSVFPFTSQYIKYGYQVHQLCLMPNGKILINVPNSEKHMHMIENAEDENKFTIIENAIALPFHIMRTMPYFLIKDPGRLIGTSCDSIRTKNLESTFYRPFILYPTPACDKLIISNPYRTKVIGAKLYNNQGEIVISQDLLETETAIDISNLPPGAYYIIIYTTKGNYYLKSLKI